MSNRIIKCQVVNEFIKGAGQVIGAAGSHDDVELELEFSPMWDGTSKRIVWFDALGENPVITILTTNLLVPGTDNTYRVPTPPEAKALDGNMMLTIRGAAVVDGVETRAVVAATAMFRVLPAIWDPLANESMDITPSQADQLQAQIEDLKQDVVKAAQASDALDKTLRAQAKAEEARDLSKTYASRSAGYMDEAGKQSALAGAHASTALQAVQQAQAEVKYAATEADRAEDAAAQAQAEAERVTVPAAAGVYNFILQDRATGQRYALLVENGLICVLEVRNDLEATEMQLVDTATGATYVLGVDGGNLYIEEAT